MDHADVPFSVNSFYRCCYHAEKSATFSSVPSKIFLNIISKKYRYQAVKQKEQSKLKIQKTRL